MRIVVCDDNRVLLEALSHALATRGFVVEAATSRPAEAVAAVKAYQPDLLLVDVSFPDGNGLDVAREVMSHHPRTRVVVLTGSDDAATAIEAARIGVAGSSARTNDSRPSLRPSTVRLPASRGSMPA